MKKKKRLIPVIDSKFQACYPTTPERARYLLKFGNATVFSYSPLIIQLIYERRAPVNEYTEKITAWYLQRAEQKRNARLNLK